MPYTPRTPEQRAELERQAKALRAQGAAMAEIERATGVPVPTLYQWAARGGWRACDLAREALEAAQSSLCHGPVHPGHPFRDPSDEPELHGPRPEWVPRTSRGMTEDEVLEPRASGLGAPTPQASQGRPPARTPDVIRGSDRPHGGAGGQETNVSADALRSAGERALAAALQLAAAGQAKAAREQLLLGQRFVAAAETVAGPGAELGAEAAHNPDWTYQDPRQELEHRLMHLLEWEMRERDRAIGLDKLEGVDLTGLSYEAFRVGEDSWRAATPEELERIRAGEWESVRSCDPSA